MKFVCLVIKAWKTGLSHLNYNKQLMNKYILARIDQNCKAWEGHRRLEKGNQVRKHQTELMEIKPFWKMESVNNHWQERIYFNCSGNNKTKQNSPKQLETHISRSKIWLLIRQEENLLLCHSLWKPGLKKKKRLHKRYMCSFSGIITGPPRFSFRFQMRSGMFRLAHLCSVSTELLSFHWQILVSPNLCTIDALKNLQISYFSQIPHWVKFFS